jgi:nucleotide-binding universal stress UspA family protein
MYKKILVPLNGSLLNECILPEVTELAHAYGAELVLLRVALAHGFPGADPTEAQVEAVRRAEKYLEGVERALRWKGLRVSTAVRYGNAAEEILDHAAFAGVDLIAMSARGRTGLARMVMGSVTDEVVRKAPCPVLTVRPAEAPPVAAAA